MNLVEVLQEKIKYSRNLLAEYQKIPTGALGAVLIQNIIDQAEKAMASGDPVAMAKALKELEELE